MGCNSSTNIANLKAKESKLKRLKTTEEKFRKDTSIRRIKSEVLRIVVDKQNDEPLKVIHNLY